MTTIRTLCLAAAALLGAVTLAGAAGSGKPVAAFTIYGTDDCRAFGADLVATGAVYALQGKASADEPDENAVLVGFPATGTCWTRKPTVPKARHPEHADKPVREYVPIGACATCIGFAAQK